MAILTVDTAPVVLVTAFAPREQEPLPPAQPPGLRAAAPLYYVNVPGRAQMLGASPAAAFSVVVADLSFGTQLRIYFSSSIDHTLSATVDPASYSVTTPSGSLAVSAVIREDSAVVLTLASAPPAGLCSVAVAAGAVKSSTGVSLIGSMLTFQGPDQLVVAAAVLDENQLRIYFGSDIDQTPPATVDPTNYIVSTSSGSVPVMLVTTEQRSIVLTLATPPIGDGTVTIVPGAVKSLTGGRTDGAPTAFFGPEELLAVVAQLTGTTLRIYFGADLNTSYASTSNPSSYYVSTPGGSLSVNSVAVSSRSVALTLSAPPPPDVCSVTVAAGSALSVSGGPVAETTLDFQGVDAVAPTVSNFSPALGAKLLPNTTVSFDVTDNRSLKLTLLVVRFGASGMTELVHDGTAFRNAYHGTRAAIPGGWRYSVSRNVGWPSAPTFQVFTIDAAGNEG